MTKKYRNEDGCCIQRGEAMRRLIIATIVVSLVLMAGCLGEEAPPAPTPTPTPAPTVTPTVTPGAAEPSGHWANCIKCHADKEDHISQYVESCTQCHGSGVDTNVHPDKGGVGHSDLGCMDSECHK
ncbi:MAG: hypothetical protein SCAL_001461 [Candidatus Syntrophoarchaeum caldarius]|uniref:Uncharacterized protein n=1 Tax=Candidatus Syntropharchaeum caldarium TaxID=1838285 RepID=A0A1F2P8P4_9EURY|nr:MAG: hypothetical protein SCAL_001461 [Candidatus Syntrophoarchaeum caldarius]